MNDTRTRRYKRYDEAFKRSAVEHWLLSGKSGRQIASELGINEQSLKQWKQKFKQLPAARWRPRLTLSRPRTAASSASCTAPRRNATF